MATGSRDGSARLWDSESGALLHTLEGHEGRVTDVAFSATGTLLATGSRDGTVRLWSPQTGEAVGTPR